MNDYFTINKKDKMRKIIIFFITILAMVSSVYAADIPSTGSKSSGWIWDWSVCGMPQNWFCLRTYHSQQWPPAYSWYVWYDTQWIYYLRGQSSVQVIWFSGANGVSGFVPSYTLSWFHTFYVDATGFQWYIIPTAGTPPYSIPYYDEINLYIDWEIVFTCDTWCGLAMIYFAVNWSEWTPFEVASQWGVTPTPPPNQCGISTLTLSPSWASIQKQYLTQYRYLTNQFVQLIWFYTDGNGFFNGSLFWFSAGRGPQTPWTTSWSYTVTIAQSPNQMYRYVNCESGERVYLYYSLVDNTYREMNNVELIVNPYIDNLWYIRRYVDVYSGNIYTTGNLIGSYTSPAVYLIQVNQWTGVTNLTGAYGTINWAVLSTWGNTYNLDYTLCEFDDWLFWSNSSCNLKIKDFEETKIVVSSKKDNCSTTYTAVIQYMYKWQRTNFWMPKENRIVTWICTDIPDAQWNQIDFASIFTCEREGFEVVLCVFDYIVKLIKLQIQWINNRLATISIVANGIIVEPIEIQPRESSNPIAQEIEKIWTGDSEMDKVVWWVIRMTIAIIFLFYFRESMRNE